MSRKLFERSDGNGTGGGIDHPLEKVDLLNQKRLFMGPRTWQVPGGKKWATFGKTFFSHMTPYPPLGSQRGYA